MTEDPRTDPASTPDGAAPSTGDRPVAARPRRTRRPAADRQAQILDVALELFAEQGYEKTSLRDIATRLGVTKAALYYHFERKDQILIALHLRLHELMRDVLAPLDDLPDDRARAEAWPGVLDRFVERTIEHPQLVLLHVRNPGALTGIVDDERNRSENEDFQQRTLRLLASPEIPLDRRVRIACSLGAVVAGLGAAGDAFAAVPVDELAGHVRDAIGDLLGPGDGA